MIYLDNAATTFPKPSSVINEVDRCIREYCGNAGRGSHKLAVASAAKIYECREECSDFFGVGAPERVIFTQNTTVSLNMAIKGLLRPGERVLISDMEHNAVLRPLHRLTRECGIIYDVFPTHPAENVPIHLKKLIRKSTRMIICAGMPNLTSNILPIGEIGEICRKHGIIFVVDGAQCAGHIPLDMRDMNIDALCMPGHKGLYGIQGCGILCLSDKVAPRTLIEGGNGADSLSASMAGDLPEIYEAGTLPTPAIAGLLEGIKEVRKRGLSSISEHEALLWNRVADKFSRSNDIVIYDSDKSGPVLTFNVRGFGADEIAGRLSRLGICVRAGYHCSALGHRTLGTDKTGAVRLSFGIFNTISEADDTADAVLSFISDRSSRI